MYNNGNGVKQEQMNGRSHSPDNSESSHGGDSASENGSASDSQNNKSQSDVDDSSQQYVKSEKEGSDDEGSVKAKSEPESDDDVPLIKKVKKEPKSDSRRSSSKVNYAENSDDDEDVPLSEKKKKSSSKKKSKRSKDSDDDEDDYETPKKKKSKNGSSSKKKRKHSSDDDDDDDFDSEEDTKKKKKKDKKEKSSSSKKVKKEKDSKKKKSSSSQSSSPTKSPSKKVKKEENEEHVWRWWEDMDDTDSDVKWRTLEHKGPLFAPPYEPLPSTVRMKYNGKPIKLSAPAEEVATFYARMIEHDYVTKEVFNKNFFKDWKKFMTPDELKLIVDLKKCDFVAINEYFKEQSEKRKAMSKEEKLKIKLENERLAEEYGTCIVDGHKQKIGNFRIEPPGLFRGRGEHPKMGKVKRRVEAENVIINIGKKAPIPEAPKGHKWKEVRHDNTVTWLVSWNENIMNGVKYIMLNPSSKLKSMKDWRKYEKARELDKLVDQIRRDYEKDWKDREMLKRQRAVALYFIDRLALRAGNEKDSDEAADTVGCCSLRVEHIKLHKQKGDKENVVDFDFLGKDSIRYENSVPVEKRVFKNLQLFMENKKPGDDLFDRLNTSVLNKYLNTLMEGLTAKVFRTYNASITLQRQLDINMKGSEDANVSEKMLAYNRANRAVAILCNHQRTVPKTFDKQMETLRTKINDKKKEIKEAKKKKKDASGAEADKFKKRVATLKDQLKKLEVQEVDKEENKQIALGTSKLNYLDPRISVAW